MTKHAAITEEGIGQLVDTFYARIRSDPLLGPVFEGQIAADAWPRHLATMKRFWSSVMLTSGAYSGNPVGVHRGVPCLERPMFAHWLALFGRTAEDLFESAPAAEFMIKAKRIAFSLELAVFHRLGAPPDGLAPPPAGLTNQHAPTCA
jgi:hemoglobin